MKKSSVYSLLIILFLAITGFVILNYKKDAGKKHSQILEFIERKGNNHQSAEWMQSKKLADVLIKKLNAEPGDIKSLNQLIAIYLKEARRSANFSYYNKAAMQCIQQVLEKEPKNFEALSFKATITLSRHQFAEGLVLAKQIVEWFPYSAYSYGILVDANVELGKYADAVTAAEKMISLRPDLRSYSRISYLREIHGDLPGAIDAMKLATESGVPGDEETEWCRVHVGQLCEQLGKINDAAMYYTISLDNRPSYPYAIAGLARIALSRKEYNETLNLFLKADSMIPDHAFKEGIVEVYKLLGDEKHAKMISENILRQMKELNSKDSEQNEEHELAHAYIGMRDLDNALKYALKEYNRRPANIEMNETVAMVYYERQEYDKAVPFIQTALSTNCKKPELLSLAGRIYAKTGNKDNAKKFLESALKNQATLTESVKIETEKILASL